MNLLLKTVRTEQALGSREFVEKYNELVTKVDAINLSIQKKEASARLTVALLSLSMFGTLAVGFLGLALQRRRVKAEEKTAKDLVAEHKEALGTYAKALFQLTEKQQLWLGKTSEDINARYTGKSLTIAKMIYEQVVASYGLYKGLEDLVATASEPLEHKSIAALFSTKNSLAVQNALSGKRSIKIGSSVDQELHIQHDENIATLWLPKVDKEKLVNLTIARNQLGESAKQAYESLLDLENAQMAIPILLSSVSQQLEEAKIGCKAIDKIDGEIFTSAKILRKLLERYELLLSDVQKVMVQDPISGRENLESLGQELDSFQELITKIRAFDISAKPELLRSISTVVDSGFAEDFLTAKLQGIATEFSKAYESIIRSEQNISCTTLLAIVESGHDLVELFATEASFAAKLLRARDEELEEMSQLVAGFAQKIGNEESDMLLTRWIGSVEDPDKNPILAVHNLQNALKEIIAEYETRGSSGGNRLEDWLQQAGVVARTLDDLIRFESNFETIYRDWSKLVTTSGQNLQSISAEFQQRLSHYLPSALNIAENERIDATSDTTVANNIEEASVYLERAEFDHNRLLPLYHARNLIQAKSHCDQLEINLREFHVRREELNSKFHSIDETEARNLRNIAILDKELLSLKSEADSPFTDKSTLNLLSDALLKHRSLRDELSKIPRDPFVTEQELSKLSMQCNRIRAAIVADFEWRNSIAQQLLHIEAECEKASSYIKRLKDDEIPDSDRLKSLFSKFERIEKSLKEVRKRFQEVQNPSWSVYENDSRSLLQSVINLIDELEGQDKKGRQALSQLQKARMEVHTASRWSGLFGVTVAGMPGRHALDAAVQYLRDGRYEDVLRSAEQAKREAEAAVRRAELEVQRRQEAENQRREAERRRKQAEMRRRSSSSSSSSIRIGGSSGGFGGFSSGGRSGGFGGFSSGGARGGW